MNETIYLVQYDSQRQPVKYRKIHNQRMLQTHCKLWAYEQVTEEAFRLAVIAVRTRNTLKAKQKYKKEQVS